MIVSPVPYRSKTVIFIMSERCRLLKAYLKIRCVRYKLVVDDVTTDFYVLLTSGTAYSM